MGRSWLAFLLVLVLISPTEATITYNFLSDDAASCGHFESSTDEGPVLFSENQSCDQSVHGVNYSLVSQGSILNGFNDDDDDLVAIELWWKPSSSSNSTVSVITIGPSRSGPLQGALSDCDRKGLDFQMVQSNQEMLITFRTNDQVFEPCRTLSIKEMPTDNIMHMVVTLMEMSQKIYINGEAVETSDEPFVVGAWNVQQAPLQLLDQQSASDNENPTLFQLSVYHMIFDTRDRFVQGLSPVSSHAFNQTITIYEDAEESPGSHSVDWYERENHQAAPIHGPMVDSINLQVNDLIRETLQDLSEVVRAVLNRTQVYVYLTQLPDVGALFWRDGTLVSTGTLIPVGTAPIDTLAYSPPHNTNGLVASFQYCVANAPIFDISQCSIPATVSLQVVPVNDPPIPQPVPKINATEGSFSIKMHLWGWDVDANDSIQAVEITKSPVLGNLTLSVSTFRSDSVPHGTPLADLNNLVTGSDPVYVQYKSQLDLGMVLVQSNVTNDSFRFRVRDQEGAWSAEETVEIGIVSAVTAHSDPTIYILEDSTGTLEWYGSDPLQRQLGFYVELVPSDEIGVLLDLSTMQPLKNGTTVQSAPGDAVQVGFRPAPDFCHSALSDADVGIRFRVVAYNTDGVVASVSDSVSQQVVVTCVLDEMRFTVSNTALSVLETSLKRTATDPCHGPIFQPGFIECETAAVIDDIVVTTNDQRTERALVSVSTNTGFLTFNAGSWNRTEPLLGRRVLSSGRVSFYAYPEDLTEVFSSLHFQSFTSGLDQIDFEIQYGSCSDWLDILPNTESFRTADCQVIRKSISIQVPKDQDKYKSETRIAAAFPWQIVFCLIVYPTVYLAFVWLGRACIPKAHDDNEALSPLEPDERVLL